MRWGMIIDDHLFVEDDLGQLRETPYTKTGGQPNTIPLENIARRYGCTELFEASRIQGFDPDGPKEW